MEEVIFRAHEASIKFGAKVSIKKIGHVAEVYLQHGSNEPVLYGSFQSHMTEGELTEAYELASRRFAHRFC